MNKAEPSCLAPGAASLEARQIPLPILECLMVLAWSSGFVGLRFAADYAPIYLMVFWRCIVLSIGLWPFVAREIRSASRATLLREAAIGAMAMGGYLAGVAKGIEFGVSAGLSALIADLLPVGTVLISTLVFRERSPAGVWAGLALGVIGVLLASRDAFRLGAAPTWALGLPIAGMLSLAAAAVWRKRLSTGACHLNPIAALWLHCVVTGILFLFLQGAQGSLRPVPTWGFAAGMAWTAILSTLGGYGLYWLCLKRSSPARVSSVLFLSPAVTLVWAWAMFREPLSWRMLFGAAVAGAGILMIVRSRHEGSR
ncbi:DMT family transporter [Burkholderia gladioli]|jgi:drug/metabolite transporter (DMT)-like permease|uniref:DMT family transporter n=1 Tax=Burkholderia gladioli TaxID=28095 RepID=UPI00163FFC9D|nr:DMT family transporter [Burkholderia gladioli]MBU9174596.1 DMT family transporter [Burkholderia gladioli]